MTGLELVPIGTLLGLLTQEILETAFAAQDVLLEKETFTLLSNNLHNICPVLDQLRNRELKDPLATKQALESLSRDVGKAKSIVYMYKNKSRFYQLIHCRRIIKAAQEVIQDLRKSLDLLSLANIEVSLDIHNNIEKLKNQMLHAEFQASQQKLEIIDKIEMGIKEHKTDQAFLNDLIRGIACAVGVPVEDSSEIKKELANFRREKEEAAEKKERGEEAFMEQIIALLSRADAARSPEIIREDYKAMRGSVNMGEELPAFDTFRCQLSKEVMHDPVAVATGQTYERARIEEWFANGHNTDPCTKEVLPVLDLKPNHKLRECIEEWAERNNCIRLCNAREKLESGEGALIKEALEELCHLCSVNYKVRYWIAEEQLIMLLVEMLNSSDKDIKHNTLLALHTILSNNEENKKQLVDAGGVELIVRCLARNIEVAKLAAILLLELLQPGSLYIPCVALLVLEKLSHEGEAILLLVTLYNREDTEAALTAEKILRQLCDKDQNIVEMARANWFVPLIERLHHGPDNSRLIMAKALGELQLTQQTLETLGIKGTISPLVEMVAGSLEYKAAALKALQNLVSCRSNRKCLAETGAVPLVIDHLFSLKYTIEVTQSAAAIFEKLALDGTTWLVDANGNPLDLGKTLHCLLELQNRLSTTSALRKHVLSSLRGLLSSPVGSEARKTFQEANGISLLLPLLEHRESEVRNAAVQVLCCLASESALDISCFIMEKKLVGLFVRLLNNEQQAEARADAAGILACLPQNKTALTKELVEMDALPALMQLAMHGNPKEKENAIGALLRFTLPADIELQKKVVGMGIHTALKCLICSGTPVSKLRAAIVLQNLSESTLKLSMPPAMLSWFCLMRRALAVCRVHGGQCGEKTTFCLIEAEVVPDLVRLLQDRASDCAGAAVDALSTLVQENETLERGAKLLHDEKAVGPLLELVSHGTENSKEKALCLLKKIFKVRKLAEIYAGKARLLLVEVATHGSDSIGKQATRVLSTLEHFEASSVY